MSGGSVSAAAVRVAHVEITQGLQIHDNSLPLVLGRPTVVRVLPATVPGQPPIQVRARLRARRGDADPWSAWISPDNPTLTAVDRPWRGDAGQAFRFTLEPDWYSASSGSPETTVETEFEVELTDPAPAGDPVLDRRRFRAAFHLRQGMEIHYTEVQFKGKGPGDRVRGQKAAGLLRAYYPVDPLALVYGPSSTPVLVFDHEEPAGSGFVDGTGLLGALNTIYFGDPLADRLYGWTHEDVYPGNGRSDPRFLAGLGRVAFGNDAGVTGDPATARWRRTFAHEMGHLTDEGGLVHPPEPYYADFYPWRLQDDQFGFDVLGVTPFGDPTGLQVQGREGRLFDFMVGGKLEAEAWIGRTNYCRLFASLVPATTLATTLATSAGESQWTQAWLISGWVGADTSGRLEPVFHLEPNGKAAEAGQYTPHGPGRSGIRFFDHAHQELRHLRIGWTPKFFDSEGSTIRTAPFNWVVLLTDDQAEAIDSIELWSCGRRLAVLPSAARPVIRNLTVTPPREDGEGRLKVDWEVDLADPKPEQFDPRAVHTVSYSHDKKQWRLLALVTAGLHPQVDLPTNSLPRDSSNTGWIRVRSAIGTQVDQKIQEVTLHAPQPELVIVLPMPDQQYAAGAAILLMGFGQLAGGRIPGQEIQWHLSTDSGELYLGNGERLVLRPGGGPGHDQATEPGQHTMVMRCEKHQVSVPINVQDTGTSGDAAAELPSPDAPREPAN